MSSRYTATICLVASKTLAWGNPAALVVVRRGPDPKVLSVWELHLDQNPNCRFCFSAVDTPRDTHSHYCDSYEIPTSEDRYSNRSVQFDVGTTYAGYTDRPPRLYANNPAG
jgi:hypothetical protein